MSIFTGELYEGARTAVLLPESMSQVSQQQAGRQAGWAQITIRSCMQLHQTCSRIILCQMPGHTHSRCCHTKPTGAEEGTLTRRNAVADGARILHCVFPDSLEVSFLIAHLSSTLLRQGHTHSLQDPVSSAF